MKGNWRNRQKLAMALLREKRAREAQDDDDGHVFMLFGHMNNFMPLLNLQDLRKEIDYTTVTGGRR